MLLYAAFSLITPHLLSIFLHSRYTFTIFTQESLASLFAVSPSWSAFHMWLLSSPSRTSVWSGMAGDECWWRGECLRSGREDHSLCTAEPSRRDILQSYVGIDAHLIPDTATSSPVQSLFLPDTPSIRYWRENRYYPAHWWIGLHSITHFPSTWSQETRYSINDTQMHTSSYQEKCLGQRSFSEAAHCNPDIHPVYQTVSLGSLISAAWNHSSLQHLIISSHL